MDLNSAVDPEKPSQATLIERHRTATV